MDATYPRKRARFPAHPQPIANNTTVTRESPNSKDPQATAKGTFVTGESLRQCAECREQFAGPDQYKELRQHILQSHNQTEPCLQATAKGTFVTGESLWQCAECREQFAGPDQCEELRQYILQSHNQTEPCPQATAKGTFVKGRWFTSQSHPIQRRETEQPGLSEIVLGLIGIPLQFLSLAKARHFFPLVLWLLGVVLLVIFTYILMTWIGQPSVIMTWMWQSLVSLVSNTFAPIASVVGWIRSATFFAPRPPDLPYLLDDFRKGLNFSSQLAKMQAISANNYEIPYLLEISEGSVGSMIVQLSSVDLPSKEKLLPLLDEYREHSANAIEGLVEAFVVIDQSVDETVHIITWVTNKMESIGQRSYFKSFIARIAALPTRADTTSVAFPLDNLTGEIGIQQLFIHMTDVIQQRLSDTLVQLTGTKESLSRMRSVLNNVASHALIDNSRLDAQKMKEVSNWRWIFREHRNKMSDYDDKMRTAASFYKHTEEGLVMLSGVISHMRELRANLKKFRNTLQDAPITIGSQVTGTLQLYVDILRSNIDQLEESCRSAKRLKQEKKAELEASRSGDRYGVGGG